MSAVLRLLWASPLPPVRSGVSDYAAELLPALARLSHVRVVTPPGWAPAPDWSLDPALEIVDVAAPPLAGEVTVVNLGNNPHHQWLLPLLRHPRVVVVAHDLVLHHLLVESTLAGGDSGAYERLLVQAHGDRGAVVAAARGWGLTGARDPFLLPARRAFLADVDGVVVHSQWAARQVQRDLPGRALVVLPMPARDPGVVDRAAERARLGVGDDELILMHLGFLTPAKGLWEILAGLGAARQLGVPVRLALVGEGDALEGVVRVAADAGLEECITTTGWVDAETMVRLPAAADLGVVLRTPSAGETSAAVVRFFAAGTPVAVSGLHQFLEWPVAAAPRVTPGPAAAAELTRVLLRAWQERDTATAAARRRAARAAWQAGHQPDAVARELVRFLHSFA